MIPNKKNIDYNRIYTYTLKDLPDIDKNFKTLDGNRQISKPHVNEIAQTIEKAKYGAKYIAPVRVDINTYNIIDGQHRVEAFRKSWTKVPDAQLKVIYEDYPYGDDHTEVLSIIADINSTNKNWSISNYIKKIEAQQNDAALKIKDFAETHWLTQKRNCKDKIVGYYPRYAYAILFGKNMSKEIKNGNIQCDYYTINRGCKLHSELQELILKLGYSMNSWFESFAQAWYDLRNYKIYNDVIDRYGLNCTADAIKIKMHGLQPVTSKQIWFSRFVGALDLLISNPSICISGNNNQVNICSNTQKNNAQEANSNSIN